MCGVGQAPELCVSLLQKVGGIKHPLRVVPLFETKEDLISAPETVEALYRNHYYRSHIDDHQEVFPPAPFVVCVGIKLLHVAVRHSFGVVH